MTRRAGRDKRTPLHSVLLSSNSIRPEALNLFLTRRRPGSPAELGLDDPEEINLWDWSLGLGPLHKTRCTQ